MQLGRTSVCELSRRCCPHSRPLALAAGPKLTSAGSAFPSFWSKRGLMGRCHYMHKAHSRSVTGITCGSDRIVLLLGSRFAPFRDALTGAQRNDWCRERCFSRIVVEAAALPPWRCGLRLGARASSTSPQATPGGSYSLGGKVFLFSFHHCSHFLWS